MPTNFEQIPAPTMSLFGSREDDPLLENDPLAPSDDPSGEEEEPPSTEEITHRETETNGEVSEANASPPSSSSDSPSEVDPSQTYPSQGEDADSVFSAISSHEIPSEEETFQFDGHENTRVIVHTATEVLGGRLTMLNAAFDEGWRLDRVELLKKVPDGTNVEGEGEQASSTLKLAFVLQKESPA